MVSILGLETGQIILIIGVVLIISLIFFRRYFSALIYDFVVDPLLSFADNFIAGAGLIGLDFGDWIAAFLIFKKEKEVEKWCSTLISPPQTWLNPESKQESD